jgi:hypothetical protein
VYPNPPGVSGEKVIHDNVLPLPALCEKVPVLNHTVDSVQKTCVRSSSAISSHILVRSSPNAILPVEVIFEIVGAVFSTSTVTETLTIVVLFAASVAV